MCTNQFVHNCSFENENKLKEWTNSGLQLCELTAEIPFLKLKTSKTQKTFSEDKQGQEEVGQTEQQFAKK